jgi:trans-aconitate methyltransferase
MVPDVVLSSRSGCSASRQFDPAHADRRLGPERRKLHDPDAILVAIGLATVMAFADVGAGPGLFTLPAAERVGPEGRIYVLDTQPEMVARARD